MISQKFLALSLLLVSPLALARVQLNAEMHINSKSTRCIATKVQLDLHESAVVYDSNDLQIAAELLDESDENVHVRYTVSAKNADEVLEIVSAPELCAKYEQPASVSVGQSEQGEEIASIVLTVTANKA